MSEHHDEHDRAAAADGPTSHHGSPGPDEEAAVPTRPSTGDRQLDDALAAFDRTVAEGTGSHVAAAAEAHRALQARLTSPPPEPPAPGAARPGPPR